MEVHHHDANPRLLSTYSIVNFVADPGFEPSKLVGTSLLVHFWTELKRRFRCKSYEDFAPPGSLSAENCPRPSERPDCLLLDYHSSDLSTSRQCPKASMGFEPMYACKVVSGGREQE